MNWVEVSIKTTAEAADIAANILYEAGVNGVVIEDPGDILQWGQGNPDWDYMDEDIVKRAVEDTVVIKGYLPRGTDEDVCDKIKIIKQMVKDIGKYGLNAGDGEVTVTEVRDEDWSSNWKKYYKPIRVGSRIVIKPSWEIYDPVDGDVVIELDPGMAFGTGTHESTTLCLELLDRYIMPGNRVIDIGCGSGILSIAAAKLGAENVLALDIDPVAVKVARDNVRLNHLEDKIIVKESDLLEGIDAVADVIVANIVADVIIRLTPDLPKHLNCSGWFIASGVIKERADDVKKAIEEAAMKIEHMEYAGEWVALACRK